MGIKKNGIDISKWQNPVNWDKLGEAYAAGQLDFVLMRAGYGYATTDPCFEGYYREATARGIPCGAYWYAYWGDGTPKQEAQAFLAAISGKSFDFGAWYDVEYEPGITGLDKATRTANVLEALNELSASGRYVGLYASTDMVNNRLDWHQLTTYDLWVAQYGSKCTVKMPYGIWQHTSTGRTAGITGNVDQDRAYKDYPSFVIGQLAAGPATTPPVETTPESKPPRVTTTIRTDEMTRGDLSSVIAKATELGLYVTGELAIGPMTEGDTATMQGMLEALGLSFEEV